MQDTLNVIYPQFLHLMLNFLGKLDWLDIYADESVSFLGYPRTICKAKWDLINRTVDKEGGFDPNMDREKAQEMIRYLRGLNTTLHLAYLEAGGVCINQGPKLFIPTEEQFDSMCHVELHMPINEFRSPHDVLIIRIPNEWRKAKCAEYKCDINRAPLHILVRYRNKVGENPFIYGVMKYPGYENHYHFQYQPTIPDRTLEDAITLHVANDWDKDNPQYDGEVRYCRDAFRSALNLCMLMTHYGSRVTGPVDPKRYKNNRKENSNRRFADFLGVQMVQNVIVRKVEDLPPPTEFSPVSGDQPVDLHQTRLYEVRPHWRRGHWRRKPGWQAYVEAGQKPPLTFVRPVLVRRDRLADGPQGSTVEYRAR